MNYGLWGIVIICATAAAVVLEIVYLVISRRRAQRLGILRVKYPVWNGNTALSAFVCGMFVILIILCAVEISHDLADLADYRARLPQDAEFYGGRIEQTENALARNRNQLVLGIAMVILQLLTIFKGGAYITKDGVLFFDSFKPLKTTARIKNGAINFYTGEKRRKYAFELPENDENKELFKNFITPEEQRAAED
ncbi:MAG: hypothetical protein K2J80_02875 [Oscillospiraceae bacterium]|nr:hypothetical protein [Oscillospiraceae bacterium]